MFHASLAQQNSQICLVTHNTLHECAGMVTRRWIFIHIISQVMKKMIVRDNKDPVIMLVLAVMINDVTIERVGEVMGNN